MRIGIVCYPTHGGSGVVASELALGLAERGHEIHIVSYATPFRLRTFHQNVFVHEVEVVSYPLFKYPPYALSLATKLVDLAKEYKLDLIHAHYAVPHAASAYLAKKMLRSENLKTVTTLHGTDITLVGLDKSFYQVVQFNIEESDGVTAVSRFLQQRTMKEFKIEREIKVIPNFVNTERYYPLANDYTRKFFASREEKIVIHASNFRPLKRVQDVIQAFFRIREKTPAKLLLIGEGPERRSIQQLTKDLKLNNDVVFLGEQDHMDRLMNCADLFVLTSEQESFGLAALEAQSCGVPVIGTLVGGLPEVVEDGITGFLVPVGEVEVMADIALELFSDQTHYDECSKRARQRALDLFGSNRIIPQYETFYREILESPKIKGVDQLHT